MAEAAWAVGSYHWRTSDPLNHIKPIPMLSRLIIYQGDTFQPWPEKIRIMDAGTSPTGAEKKTCGTGVFPKQLMAILRLEKNGHKNSPWLSLTKFNTCKLLSQFSVNGSIIQAGHQFGLVEEPWHRGGIESSGDLHVQVFWLANVGE